MMSGGPRDQRLPPRGLQSRRRVGCLLVSCGFAVLLSSTAPGFAGSDEPAEVFLRSADEAFQAASRRRVSNTKHAIDRTRRVVDLYFDVPLMAQEIVAPMWADATQSERDELVRVLADRLVRQAVRERSGIDRAAFVFFDRQELDDGSLLVSAYVSAKGRRRTVTWRLVQRHAGFRITDVVTESGGLIADLRSRFSAFKNRSNGISRFSEYLAD